MSGPFDVSTIAQFVATKAAGVSGIRGASPSPVDTLPGTPYAVVQPVRTGSVIPGSWERVHMTFPLRIYIGRIADAVRTQGLINPFVNDVLAAFRTSGTESGTVASTLVTTWESDLYEVVGSETYQVLQFEVEVIVNNAVGYTP